MTRLFASDFDGTLHFHDPNVLVSQQDLDAIAAFRAAGGLFGVCTGRALKGLTAQTAGHIDFDFYITTSGASLFDGSLRPIWQRTLPKDTLREMHERYAAQLSEGEFQLIVASDTYWSFDKLGGEIAVPQVSSFDEIEGPFLGFSIETRTVEAATAYAQDFNRRYANVAIAHQNLNSIDVVPAGCTKGTGLAKIARHFGASLTAGIGDSFNDLPLLEAADVAYTFNSSAEEVRAGADVLVDHVSEAIYDFMTR